MYTPSAFKQEDLTAARELVERDPFGILVSVTNGTPAVTHLPFTIDEGPLGLVLSAHMAKANPHWRQLEGAVVLVMFRGVHGYISPRWYTDPKHDVPTWNYAVVHCTGTAHIATEDQKARILARLVDRKEAGAPQPWTLATMDKAYFENLKGGIVAFTVTVEKLDAKFKLSQNRGPDDREGAIRGLLAGGDPDDARLAEAMRSWAPSTRG
ncbi:MAG: FMN-binding negative transcriptional regulator [Vulcanimicrobiaceae bacterium]